MLTSKFNVVSINISPNNTSSFFLFHKHLEHLHTSQSSSIPKVTIDPSNRKMQITYLDLMLGHGSPKSLISHQPLQNFIDVLQQETMYTMFKNPLGQCKLIYSLPMVGSDKNAAKATNVTSKDRLMVASYCNFTIFPTSTTLIVHVMCVVVVAPLATIS